MAKDKELEKVDGPEFDVIDPEVAKPRVLPLVVQPAGGIDETKPFLGWKNKRQMDFAKIVSAYAYQNPAKWAYVPVREDGTPTGLPSKKDRLIAKLSALGNMPDIAVNPDAPKITVNGSKVG